jgi:hypothetical protein
LEIRLAKRRKGGTAKRRKGGSGRLRGHEEKKMENGGDIVGWRERPEDKKTDNVFFTPYVISKMPISLKKSSHHTKMASSLSDVSERSTHICSCYVKF